MKKSIPLIVNPASGKGDSFSTAKLVKDSLPNFEIKIIETHGLEDTARISAEIARGEPESLIVMGGDGTLNGVCQSFVGRTGTSILVVPTGTGSDFARSLGISGASDAVRAILGGRTVETDSVRCTGPSGTRVFLNIMEVGYGAMVMRRVNSVKRKGRHVFTRSALMEILHLRTFSIELTGDFGTVRVKSPEVVIANGKYFGGGMKASPNSDPSDGILEIHVIREIGKFRLLTKLGKLVNGSYISDPVVMNMETGRLSITGDPAPLEADGEHFGNVPVDLEVISRSFRFYRN